MKQKSIAISLLAAALLLSGLCRSYAQTNTDAERYRQQQAAERTQAQRARQAERAQAAKQADKNSEVAAETAAYLTELARIQKHNNHVADYMTRDIGHRVALWADAGACTRLDLLGMKGGGSYNLLAGGALGVGYQMRHNLFLFTTGLEFRSVNYVHSSGFTPSTPTTYTSYNLGYLQIPLLLGMELPNWYWQLGAKAGYKLMDIHNTGIEPLRFGPAFEIGMNFDKWSRPQIPAGQEMTPQQRTQFRMHYKLALFGECGMWLHPNPTGGPARLQEDMMLGLKFTAAYQFRRKPKKMEPLPSRPHPAMHIEVRDAQGRPVENAIVAVHDRVAGSTFHATTPSTGKAVIRSARGEYDIRAFRSGKKAEILNHQHISLNGDTLILALNQDDDTPPEVRIVDEEEIIIPNDAPCLVGRVCDSETGAPINAVVRIGNWKDTASLYRGDANDKGVYVTRLHRGDYTFRVRKPGYMQLSNVYHFDKDSIILKLKPIHVGNTAKVKDIFFVKDKGTLMPESETSLAQLALFLRQNPDVCIRLTVHTDNQGDENGLIRLSKARGRVLKRNLVNRGIDADRIVTEGKGGTQPVADNNSDYGRALNQRVVMEIISVNGPAPAQEQ